jgi:hypothetical protein
MDTDFLLRSLIALDLISLSCDIDFFRFRGMDFDFVSGKAKEFLTKKEMLIIYLMRKKSSLL